MGLEATENSKHRMHRPHRRSGPQTCPVRGAWLLGRNPQIKSALTGSPAGSLRGITAALDQPVSMLVWQHVQGVEGSQL